MLRSLLLLTLFFVGQVYAAEAAKRPNILFIFTDDHALKAIGAYGGKQARTPNIDRLAQQGMLFRHSLVCNSICGPSRAVALTGKYNHINGFIDNHSIFDNTQQTYPKLLQKAGYQTAVIGKWHLESEPTGFDHWMVLPGQGHYYNPDFITAQGKRKIEGYCTDIITEEAVKWLKEVRDSSKPFMLCYWHKAPHREWSPGPQELGMFEDVTFEAPDTLFDDYSRRASPAKYHEMGIDAHMTLSSDLKMPTNSETEDPGSGAKRTSWYSRLNPEQKAKWDAHYEPIAKDFHSKNPQGEDLVRWKYQRYMRDYHSVVAGVDKNIGRMLQYLEESGLAENTIVIYSSDQGFYLGEHGWFDKRWMYEESLHTPLIVRWPGKVKPNSVCSDLVSVLDYAPTLLDVAGVEIPADMQGRSFMPLLKQERPADWRTAHYYHYYEFPMPHHVAPHYGVRTADGLKLIHYYDQNEWELFDLNTDPQEMTNLYGQPKMATQQSQLLAQLQELQIRYKDTEPTKIPANVTRPKPAGKGKAKAKGGN
jgi:arylsulfatase A-like enzyme